MKRATFFKPAGAASPEQPRTSRQSIRGRISAPIPMPDPLAPNEFPIPNPPPSAYGSRQEPPIAEEEPLASQPPVLLASNVSPGNDESLRSVSTPEPKVESELEPETASIAAETAHSPAQSMSILQAPKVRPVAGSPATGHRRMATLEQQQQTASSGQLPLQSGPGSSPASAGPSASASASTGAANSASSPAFRHRTNPSSTLRYSEVSGISAGAGTSAGNTTVSGSPKPQRKKSTLRGALSKLFGRRKKVDSQLLSASVAPGQGQSHDMGPQHRSVRSDPTVLGRPRDSEPKRSASLPITEYDRALRSHSIGPEEIAAIESARNSFQVEGGAGSPNAGGRQRAATATNRMLFPQHGRRRNGSNSADLLSGGEWAGLSPRPASAHGRGSNNRLSGFALGATHGGGMGLGFDSARGGVGRLDGATDPDEIGRAITSDVAGGNDFGHRRRSRSLSGINDVAFEQTQARRRSDEIRFWRESYDPAFLSPLSSGQNMDIDDDGETEDQDDHGDRDDLDEEVDDEMNDDENGQEGSAGKENAAVFQDIEENTGAASLLQSLPDSPITQEEEQLQQQRQRQNQRPRTPPQPFAFGNLSNLGASSGTMKITQAGGMDIRLDDLEARMHNMERVVDQLCHSVPGFKAPLAAAAPQDQVPRSIPPFPNSASLQSPSATSAQPAIPPIPAIYQTQATNDNGHSASYPYALVASSSRYSSSRQSGHSGQSLDSDMPSHMSFGDGQTYVASLYPPSSSATQTQSVLAPAPGASSTLSPGGYSPALRPTSTSTVRGVTSLPTLSGGGDGTSHSLAASSTADLVAQLESERVVRETLEKQVKKLNERVNALSTTMYAMLRDPAGKPRSSREPLASPSSSSLREQAARASSTHVKAEPLSRLATKLGHEEPADAESEPEDFQTPMEDVREDEPNYNYNYTDNDNSAANSSASQADSKRRKKAARTLSLGQLTLGKSAVQT